ncbi:MAG: AtpZ/AtpI family protein [Thermodesulfovibrionales bacterium]
MAEKEKPLWKQLWEASTAGLNLVISTFIGLAIGYALDKYVLEKWIGIKTFPWLTIIFLILGIVSGFRDLFRIASKK